MSSIFRAGILLVAGCLSHAVSATQDNATAPAGVLAPLFNAPQVVIGSASVPGNTVVQLEIIDPVGSESSHKGDLFKLRVVEPIVVDGAVVVPAGTLAMGQVVHAAKSGAGGKGGELLLAARYLDLPTGQVKLRSTFGAAGQAHAVASLVVAEFVGPFGMIVHGNRVEIPTGTRISARIAPPPVNIAVSTNTASESPTAAPEATTAPAVPAPASPP